MRSAQCFITYNELIYSYFIEAQTYMQNKLMDLHPVVHHCSHFLMVCLFSFCFLYFSYSSNLCVSSISISQFCFPTWLVSHLPLFEGRRFVAVPPLFSLHHRLFLSLPGHSPILVGCLVTLVYCCLPLHKGDPSGVANWRTTLERAGRPAAPQPSSNCGDVMISP